MGESLFVYIQIESSACRIIQKKVICDMCCAGNECSMYLMVNNMSRNMKLLKSVLRNRRQSYKEDSL